MDVTDRDQRAADVVAEEFAISGDHADCDPGRNCGHSASLSSGRRRIGATSLIGGQMAWKVFAADLAQRLICGASTLFERLSRFRGTKARSCGSALADLRKSLDKVSRRQPECFRHGLAAGPVTILS